MGGTKLSGRVCLSPGFGPQYGKEKRKDKNNKKGQIYISLLVKLEENKDELFFFQSEGTLGPMLFSLSLAAYEIDTRKDSTLMPFPFHSSNPSFYFPSCLHNIQKTEKTKASTTIRCWAAKEPDCTAGHTAILWPSLYYKIHPSTNSAMHLHNSSPCW